LGQLIDPDRLEVAFRISAAQHARLSDAGGRLADLPVRVRLDVLGLDLERAGRLSRDSAAVAEGQSGRLVYAALEAAGGLRPGDFVTVTVDEPPLEDVVSLPGSALDGSGTVLVLGAGDRLEVLPVDLLRRQGNIVLVRGAGLAGREVVVQRSPLLGAGIGVRPLRGADGTDQAAPQEEAALLELSAERRARLVAYVEGNARMPAEMRDRLLVQLQAERVPADVVERLEQRIGG
jgi:membrane fusion protein, multidrug efflux system